MSVKLLIEHHLEFLRLKGSCTGSPESPLLVKMPHCWKSLGSYLISSSSYNFIRVNGSLDMEQRTKAAFIETIHLPKKELGLEHVVWAYAESRLHKRLLCCTPSLTGTFKLSSMP